MHEYFHAIKRYLSIVTNGLIFSETLDKNDNNEEVGFLFEYFFFGWPHDEYINNNIQYKNNSDLYYKIIDVNTALKILNLDLYNYNLSSIHDILYNNKNSKSFHDFENKSLNKNLKKFLFDIGFDSQEKLDNLRKDKSKIKAARNISKENMIFAGFECGNNKRKKYI